MDDHGLMLAIKILALCLLSVGIIVVVVKYVGEFIELVLKKYFRLKPLMKITILIIAVAVIYLPFNGYLTKKKIKKFYINDCRVIKIEGSSARMRCGDKYVFVSKEFAQEYSQFIAGLN